MCEKKVVVDNSLLSGEVTGRGKGRGRDRDREREGTKQQKIRRIYQVCTFGQERGRGAMFSVPFDDVD